MTLADSEWLECSLYVTVRACERSGKRSGAGGKLHERERSGERVLKKIMGAERSGQNRPLKSAHTNIGLT